MPNPKFKKKMLIPIPTDEKIQSRSRNYFFDKNRSLVYNNEIVVIEASTHLSAYSLSLQFELVVYYKRGYSWMGGTFWIKRICVILDAG